MLGVFWRRALLLLLGQFTEKRVRRSVGPSVRPTRNKSKAYLVPVAEPMVDDLSWDLSPSKDLVIVVSLMLSYALMKSRDLFVTNLQGKKCIDNKMQDLQDLL